VTTAEKKELTITIIIELQILEEIEMTPPNLKKENMDKNKFEELTIIEGNIEMNLIDTVIKEAQAKMKKSHIEKENNILEARAVIKNYIMNIKSLAHIYMITKRKKRKKISKKMYKNKNKVSNKNK
jgi:hypothetical protein